ncbi:MAG: hypothetical protein ACOYMF_18020 [Bacteroidales bacterium]
MIKAISQIDYAEHGVFATVLNAPQAICSDTTAYLSEANHSWNIFSVAAAAIYIYNIVDAITAKGAKRYANYQPRKVEFAPMMADQSVGLWVCIKF